MTTNSLARSAKSHEGVLEGVLGAVVIEVVGVDVRDERDRGVVEQEGAVGFVGLDDEQLALARCRAATPRLRDDAAVDEARVVAELAQAVTIMPVEVVLPCAPATATRRGR